MRGAHRLARRALSLKAGRRPSTALAHTSSPEFLDQRLSKSTLEAATTDATGAVWLRWSDGAGGSFHPLWLRDNCPSVRHAASRQKLVSAAATRAPSPSNRSSASPSGCASAGTPTAT